MATVARKEGCLQSVGVEEKRGGAGGEVVDGKPMMGRNCIRSRAITLPAPADAALHPHCILALCCNWLDA